MKKIHQAHDRIFKSGLSDPRIARDFLSHHLPTNIQSRIDLNTLQLCSNNFIAPELRELKTDVLFSVKLKVEQAGMDTAFLYLHLEEEKNPHRFMPFRMIKYSIPIIEKHLKETRSRILPVIFPIVVYTGEKPYPYSVNIFDLFGEQEELAREWMFSRFKLIDLSTIPDEELRNHRWSGLLEILMKHIKSSQIMALLEDLSSEFHRLEKENAQDYLLNMIEYVLTKANLNDKQAFFNWVKKNLSPTIEKKFMTIAEQLHTEGIQQGIQQGMQQGALEGERTILKKQMTWRFSSIPEKYIEKINQATSEEIEIFAKKFLDAKSVEEIFKHYH